MATPDEPFGKAMQRYQQSVENEDFEDASDALLDMFAHVEEWRKNNPSPELELSIAAHEFEQCSDWGAAESAYVKILSLSDIGPATEYKAHSNLASLCLLLGRNSEALVHSRFATAAARRDNLSSLLAMALREETQSLIRCGAIAVAINTVNEAINTLNVLTNSICKDTLLNQMRASLLTLRAECAIGKDALSEAEVDLGQAFNLLETLAAMDIAAGVHRDIADWWAVVASLRAKQDNLDGTIRAWQKAVANAKHVASLPHSDNVYAPAYVAKNLKGLGDALALGGRPDDAAAAFDERNAILLNIGVLKRDAD